jgi:hypothetical protein
MNMAQNVRNRDPEIMYTTLMKRKKTKRNKQVTKERKHPRKGEKKKQRGKDQSPGKQTAQTE